MSYIVIFCMGYPPFPGGVERYSEEIAKAYRNKGKKVIVITQSNTLPKFSYINRIPVFSVKAKTQAGVFFAMCKLWFALKKRIHCEFIHATTWRLSLPSIILTRQLPLVISVHGLEVLKVPSHLKPLQHHILKNADYVLGVSKTALNSAEIGVTEKKGKWLRAFNGLTYIEEAKKHTLIHKKPNSDSNQLLIYTFCRLVERKNVQGAITAIAMLLDKGISNFKYIIAGGGPMLEELKQLALDKGVTNKIEFLGYIPEEDVIERYKAADIFLHPQITASNGQDIEGFGITIADAMSFGCIPIVGISGGPSEFVSNNTNGLVINGNNHNEIVGAIEKLITSPLTRRKMSESAREWSNSNLSWNKHVAKLTSEIRIKNA